MGGTCGRETGGRVGYGAYRPAARLQAKDSPRRVTAVARGQSVKTAVRAAAVTDFRRPSGMQRMCQANSRAASGVVSGAREITVLRAEMREAAPQEATLGLPGGGAVCL